jgi:hypothetical protein
MNLRLLFALGLGSPTNRPNKETPLLEYGHGLQ